MTKTTLILDSSNLLYRLFWAWDARGESIVEDDDVTIVYTFLNCFKSYVNKYDADNIYACWDRKLDWPSTNFRKEAADVEYKGTRDYSKTASLHDKDHIIRDMVESLGVKNMHPKVMEADDVISWLCSNLTDTNIVIVSSDQDMWQLVNEKVCVYNPIKKVEINNHNFEQFSPVPLKQYIAYKSFIGDASDNIEGVKGIGKVRAKRILNEWPESKELLTTEQAERLARNVKLMDLSYGYTVHDGEEASYSSQYEDNKSLESDFTKFKSMCEKYEFHSILSRISLWEEIFGKKKLQNDINLLIERLGLNK